MIRLRNRETWDTARRYIYKGIYFVYDADTGYYETWYTPERGGKFYRCQL